MKSALFHQLVTKNGALFDHVTPGGVRRRFRRHGNAVVVEADQFAREAAQRIPFLADIRVGFGGSISLESALERINAARDQLRVNMYRDRSSHENIMRTSKDCRVNRRVSRRDTGFQWYQRLNPENSRLCVPLSSRTNRWEMKRGL